MLKVLNKARDLPSVSRVCAIYRPHMQSVLKTVTFDRRGSPEYGGWLFFHLLEDKCTFH